MPSSFQDTPVVALVAVTILKVIFVRLNFGGPDEKAAIGELNVGPT